MNISGKETVASLSLTFFSSEIMQTPNIKL